MATLSLKKERELGFLTISTMSGLSLCVKDFMDKEDCNRNLTIIYLTEKTIEIAENKKERLLDLIRRSDKHVY